MVVIGHWMTAHVKSRLLGADLYYTVCGARSAVRSLLYTMWRSCQAGSRDSGAAPGDGPDLL